MICDGHWILSCDIAHETEGMICYEHWLLCLVSSYTRQGVRFVPGTHETGVPFVTGIGSQTRKGVRFVTGIGFCVL